MNALIAVSVFLFVALIVTLIIVRVTRNPEHVPPRRREFDRLHKKYVSAAMTIAEIMRTLETYRLSLDAQGEALGTEITRLVREHNDKILEIDK